MQALLNQLIQALQNLQTTLAQENQALEQSDVKLIQKIANIKTEQVKSVNELTGQLSSQVQALGQQVKFDSIKAFLLAHPDMGDATSIDQLQSLTEDCNKLNTQNGTLVNARMNLNNRKMDLMLGNDGTVTYDRQGKPNKGYGGIAKSQV